MNYKRVGGILPFFILIYFTQKVDQSLLRTIMNHKRRDYISSLLSSALLAS